MAVEGGRTVFAESLEVGGGAVALVLGKTILGILRVEFAHEAVTRDFGEDAGGGDGEGESIAVNDALLGNLDFLQHEGIEQERVRSEGEGLKRAIHGEMRCFEDIELVYLGLRGGTHGVGSGDGADGLE